MSVKKTPIVWLTGMSGAGKTTLSLEVLLSLQKKGYKVRIVDGDDVRNKYKKRLGFSREDVMTNNMYIVQMCKELREAVDLIIVPVISPFFEVRDKVRECLEPNFHLVYLKVDIECLKVRDTKGLYLAADKGEVTNLIGYSESTPYEEPKDAEVTINTSGESELYESKRILMDYIKPFLELT